MQSKCKYVIYICDVIFDCTKKVKRKKATHPEQEGEFRVPVANVAVFAIGHINQGHYHLTKAHEGAVDAASFLKEKQ